MNIDTIRVFCDVIQHQSFSRGAALNEVSQSAATQSVHRLERHFGVQLVDRTKRPFVLTPEGQACFDGFREVLELYDSVDARVRSLRMEIAGLVRVASIYSVGLHDMSRCMQDFMRRYPKAKVRLEYLRPNKVYEAVLNGEVDLGLVSYPTASADLNVIPLRSERMVLVCPLRHSLANQEAVTAEHLQGEDFVGFDRDLIIRKEVDRYLRQRGVNIRVVMEFDNIETIKQAVEIGAGVSILPEPTVRQAAQEGELAIVRLIAPELRRPLGIIHRQRKVFTPTAAKFVELLQQAPVSGAGGDVMREAEVPVTFQSLEKTVYVLRGTKLLEAAAGAGRCVGLAVRRRGDLRKVPRRRRRRGRPAHARRRKVLLRGRTRRRLPAGVSVRGRGPHQRADSPRFVAGGVASDHGAVRRRGARRRWIRSFASVTSSFAPPARGDDAPDLLRLEREVGPFAVDLELLRGLPRLLRQNGFRGTAVLADGSLLDFEPDNTEWHAYAAAFDVGTTTLVGALLDANSGRDLAVVSRLNPQTRFGDDVLARILRVRTDPDGMAALQAGNLRSAGRNARRALPGGGHSAGASLRTNAGRQHHHAATALRRGPLPWARCRLFRRPAAVSWFPPRSSAWAFIPAAARGFCRSLAVSSAATRWPGFWPRASSTRRSRHCSSTSAPTARSCFQPGGNFGPLRPRPGRPSRAPASSTA